MRSTLPLPRRGWLGTWDRLVGPGMTTAELSLVLSVSLIAAILGGLNVWNLDMGWLLALISAVIAFDVIGGAVCNLTQTTKRWVHREGTGAKEHLRFIALHGLEVQLSDTEAVLYGAIFIVLLSLILFNLWFAATELGTTVGTIFSIISYSWEFVDSALALPMTLQSWSRLSEIMRRLNSRNEPAGAQAN